MPKENKSYLSKRKMGSEWEDWDSSDPHNQIKTQTSSTVFLFLLSVVNVIYMGLLFYSIYLIQGLTTLNITAFTRDLIELIVTGIATYNFIIYLLLILTLLTKRPFAIFLKEKQFVKLFLTKITLTIGIRLGINQDRIIHSMLRINNSLTRIVHHVPKAKEEVVILAPRCLTKEIRGTIEKYTKDDNYQYHIVAGGTQARKVLEEVKPKGIIAIACERDLNAGIKDVPNHIPVIAISNQRPNGPCKDTVIDIEEFKEAIDFMVMDSK